MRVVTKRDGQSTIDSPTELPEGAAVGMIYLLKGVVYRDSDEEAWRDVIDHRAHIADYLLPLRLDLVVDESEGYAFVRQIEADDSEAGREIPRLIPKRPLGYAVSLLCVLLRKRLAEHDSSGGDARLILSREQLIELIRVFLPESSNEARIEDMIDQASTKLVDYGILRRLRSGSDILFEVRRIIKALVDASWLAEMNEKLEVYKKHADDTL